MGRHIDTIEQQMGVRFLRKDGKLILLGRGVYGCVIALEDVTRVFKITSDEEEGPITAWIQFLQSQDAAPGGVPIIETTTKIDKVFRFPDKIKPSGHEMRPYGIIREAVDTDRRIPVRLAEVLDACVDGWEVACSSLKKSKQDLGRMMADASILAMTQGAYGKQAERLGAHLEWFQKSGTPLMDIHRSNVAYRIVSTVEHTKRGQIVMYDFGASQLCDTIPGEIHDLIGE